MASETKRQAKQRRDRLEYTDEEIAKIDQAAAGYRKLAKSIARANDEEAMKNALLDTFDDRIDGGSAGRARRARAATKTKKEG